MSMRSVAILCCTLLLAAAQARAQTANDGYAPSVNGVIHAIAVQPDGRAPIGQNYWLRAEGRTGGGIYNGSQGLVDSVRQVWRDDRIFADGFE